VEGSRELEQALGDGIKRVEENEQETVIIQRRSLRATRYLPVGALITPDCLEPLRPAPSEGLPPCRLYEVVGQRLARPLPQGEALTADHLEEAVCSMGNG